MDRIVKTARDVGADRILKYLAEGRLLRLAWRDNDGDGSERACLLAALVPECGHAQSVEACPAATLWPWLAHLTPWLDDSGSAEAWPGVVRRYAAVVRRLDPADAEGSRRCEYAVRSIAVREAMRRTTHPRAIDACQRVAEACEAVAAGGEIDARAFSEIQVTATSTSTVAWSAAGTHVASVVMTLEKAAYSESWPTSADRMIDQLLRVLERHVGLPEGGS